MPKRDFASLSVSRKTVFLLLVFVLLPSVLAGSIFIYGINIRNERTADRLALEKLENRAHGIDTFMNSVSEIGKDLAEADSVRDVLRYGLDSNMHTACTDLLKKTMKYNQKIQKIQLIRDGEVIWNYGKDTYYIFNHDEKDPYVGLMESGAASELWSEAHKVFSLKQGAYTEECWITTYYCSVTDPATMEILGVIGVLVLEEDYCRLYEDIPGGASYAAFLLNAGGDVLSATDRSLFLGGLSEKTKALTLQAQAGQYENIRYGRGMATLYKVRCGDTGNYLVWIRERDDIIQRIFLFILLMILLFLIFCVAFLLIYKRLVIQPLEVLSGQMEKAKHLDFSCSESGENTATKDEIRMLSVGFQNMMEEIQDLIGKVYIEKIKAQEAEQKALLEQINPHFLYNTLDSIHWNALRHGDRETGEQLEALSDMLRETLNVRHRHTTIERELSIVRNYCYLLEARFQKEIEVQIFAEEKLLQTEILKLILQPLVENAYRHGLESVVGEKKIWIKVRSFGGRIFFYVADNGVGCDRMWVLEQLASEEDTGKCFALRNIRDRLRLEYGEAAGFHFWSKEGIGTIVKLYIPDNTTKDCEG